MANRIVNVGLHTGIYGIGIYAIMLPSSGFSVAHCSMSFVGINNYMYNFGNKLSNHSNSSYDA